MRKLNEIIIHCSATKEGQHFTVEDIRRWHKQRGFTDVGYHFVIYLDGSVHKGRPIEKIGAHCSGHNANSVGVCYIGGLDKGGSPRDTRTAAQRSAMAELIAQLRSRYGHLKVHGHRDYAAKACPCFDAHKEYGGV